MADTVRERLEPIESAISLHSTVQEAIQEVKKKAIHNQIVYFYVVDTENRLQGIVSTRQLLLSEPTAKIADLMHKDVISIDHSKTMKEAVLMFAKHPLLALPVIDEERRLLGLIDVQTVLDEKMDVESPHNRHEIFQLIGLRVEDGAKVPLLTSYRLRMPWLLCNVFSGIICAIISRIYEGVLAKYLLFAFFIPLVLTLSESSSMQSMTQSLQFLRRPRFHWKNALKRGKREWQLVWLLAISSGALVGAISLLWEEGMLASLVIGCGIVGSVALSALFGILIPVFLHRLKLDPKVAAGPVVLMIADILTTLLYLSLASFWLL